MAAIGEAYALCRVFQRNNLLSVEKHCEENHVILTFKDRGVLVYNLANNKLVHSLAAQQKQEFTCPVVHDPRTRKYIGVINDTKICQWSEESVDLSDCQSFEVETAIASIKVSCGEVDHEPLVVFVDGTVSFLNKCPQKSRNSKRKAKPKNIVKRVVHSAVLYKEESVFVGVFKNKDSKNVLSVTRLDEAVETHEAEIVPPSLNAELLCCCVSNNAMALSYWSDGCLCSCDITSLLVPDTALKQPIQLHNKLLWTSKLPDSSISKSTVSMVPIGSSHICHCGSQKAKDDTLQVCLSVIDTRFGTLQASKSLQGIISSQATTGANTSPRAVGPILATSGYVCVGLSSCVAACPCRVEQSSLATALGKLSSYSTTGIPQPLLCIPQLPKPTEIQDLSKWRKQVTSQQTTEESSLEKLTDPGKTSTATEFTSELRRYLDSKCSAHEQDEKVKHSPVKRVKKQSFKAKEKLSTKRALLSQPFVLSVLSRCLTEEGFWPTDALSCLLQTCCVPASSSPELLQRLMEKKDINLIMQCFKYIKGIPEPTVVSSLQFVLSADSSVFGEEDGETNMTDRVEESGSAPCLSFGDKQTKLLCLILCYPVNDVFIQSSAKILTTKNLCVLLQFLTQIVQQAPLKSFSSHQNSLPYSTVLDWTGWLMNAHYTSLVLMPEVHQLLLDLHESVQDQVTLFRHLSRLDGFLSHLKSKQPLPGTRGIGQYTIEMIEL